MSIVDRIHGIQKKVAAGAIAAATLIAGMGLVAPAYAADFTLVGPDTVPSSDKFQITALGLPADVATDDITWETSQWRNAMQSIWPQDQGNTSTWDADMTPYEDGMVTISATYQGQTAEKTVKVEKRSYQYLAGFDLTADGLEGSDGEYTLHIPSGGTVETSATFNPENATYQHLIWQSMDPSVVRGGADGVIRAVGNGTADLIAYSYGRIHKKTIHVTVGGDAPVNIPVESVAINGGDVTMQAGETKTLSATVSPSNATNKKITWSTSNPMIASVDNSGTITARKAGTATIKATAGDKSASVTVTIEEAPPAPYASVKIDGGDFSVKAGETRQLTAKLLAADGTEVTSGDTLTWRSSNTAVASVDANGLVTGVAKGIANITVTVGDKSDAVAATVTEDEPVANSTTIYYPSSKYGANSTYLHWRFANGTWTTAPGDKMSAACDGYVSFTIANPDAKDIEFVFNNGNGTWDNKDGVSGQNYMASGETVVITNNSGNYATVAPCVVTIPVESVTIAGSDFTLKEGDAKKIAATVAPTNATDKTVTWTSSDASVATVDASGTVKAVKAGTATITATAGGKSAIVTVTVKGEDPIVAVQSVSIAGGDFTLDTGKTKVLSATVKPDNATNKAVAWSSSDASVASVDASGKVTAKKAGTATITAKSGGKSASVKVSVKAVASVSKGDSLGVRRGNRYYVRNSLSSGNADVEFTYGLASDQVLVGDWDGDGKDTLVLRRGNRYYVRNSLTPGHADKEFTLGLATDQVLVGDWDGDGKDTLMLRRGNQFLVYNTLGSSTVDRVFYYGLPSDVVLVGDWNGDGKDTLAMRRGVAYYMRNSLGSG
ncbi:Bacterial Ig-like domain (group 2), partial [Bifidobacterium pseudolongum subsp. globosum]